MPTSMTRQHFQAIADAVKETKDYFERLDNNPSPDEVIETVAQELMREVRRFNPSFDRDRFLTACGFGE